MPGPPRESGVRFEESDLLQDLLVLLLSHGDELSLFCERTVLDRALEDAA